MTFGENLKAIREQKGLSQRELGERLGVRQQTVAQYENAEDQPKMKTIRRLATALDIPIYRLVSNWQDFSSDEFCEDLATSTTQKNDIKKDLLTEGELIKAARKSRGLTQKQLAEKSGLAVVTIQQYERNLRQPRLENIKKIALALNMLTDDLLSPVNILESSDFDKEKMEYWEPGYFTESHTLKLNAFFKRLNVFGQEKAIEQVELLTKIPEYTKKIESRELEMYHRKEELEKQATPPDQSKPELFAAHARTDVEQTPEGQQHDSDIMHNPDEWE